MAPRRRRLLRSNSSILVSVADHKEGFLVFRFDVKRLFSGDGFDVKRLFSGDGDQDDNKSRSRRRRRPREVLPLPPSHVACFRSPSRLPMDLAASPGGDKIVAATGDGHIMVYDATRSQHTYDHGLRCWKLWPVLLAALSSSSRSRPPPPLSRRRRDDMLMLVATNGPDLSKPAEPSFEAVRLTSGGRLQPLPVPPPLLFGEPLPASSCIFDYMAEVTSHFVARGRVWLSVGRGAAEGTYSYSLAADDMADGLGWRVEGSWVLPLVGRAVYVTDLGRPLLLGFNRDIRTLCAIDMEPSSRPPVVLQHWTWAALLPTKDDGYSEEDDYLCYSLGGLAYLGGGRLCISWSSPYRDHGRRMLLALTAVELTIAHHGELLLRKRGSRCYRLPPKNQKAVVLPVL